MSDALVGVDINDRRMHTCKSIVTRNLLSSRNDSEAHCLLVVADGASFNRVHGDGSEVVFDSSVFKSELKV